MPKYKISLQFTAEIDSELPRDRLLKEVNKLGAEFQKTTGNQVRLTKSAADVIPEGGVIERLGEFAPEQVLPHIGSESRCHFVADNAKSYGVSMKSQRYYVFRDSLKCVACGIEGTKFFLERTKGAANAHFNLYAVEGDGKLVMMTKDHIKPKFEGGENHHSNYQTMCATCNTIKGCMEMPLDVVRKLRMVLQENRHLPKKILTKLMQDRRVELLEEFKPSKSKKKGPAEKPIPGVMWTTADLNLYKLGEADLWAYSVYSSVDPTVAHIACLRRKTPVTLVSQEGESVLVKTSDVEFRTWLRNLSQTKDGPGPEESDSLDVLESD